MLIPVAASEIFAAAFPGAPHARFYLRSPSVRLLHAMLPRYLRPGLAVLDIGCGNAIGACHLVASGAQHLTYVGIDPDPDACDRARGVLQGLPADSVRGHILQQSLQEYLASARSGFDLILCTWAFRDCVDLNQPATHGPVTAAIAGLLAPGGVLFVGDAVVAPGASAAELDRIRRYHDPVDTTGQPAFPPAVIEELFTRAALVLVEHHDVLALPLARFLGMPHDRYCLQVFRRAGR